MLQNASEAQQLDLQRMFPESNLPFSISEEWMIQSAMKEAFEAKQKAEGMKLFSRLESMPTKEAKSHYFFLTACYRDPNRGELFQKLAANWLATKPADEWTLELTHYLGLSYYNDDKHAETARMFSQILESSLSLQSLPPPENAMIPNALSFLVSSLEALGEKEEAKKLRQILAEQFPNHPQL